MKKALVQISYADIEAAFGFPAGSLVAVRSPVEYARGLAEQNTFTGLNEQPAPEFDAAGGPVFKLHTVGPEVATGDRIPFVPLAELRESPGAKMVRAATGG